MKRLFVIAALAAGVAGVAYGVNAERLIRSSARNEADAWSEVRKLEHLLLNARLEVQDCERRLYLTEKDVKEKLGLLAVQRCRLLPGSCC